MREIAITPDERRHIFETLRGTIGCYDSNIPDWQLNQIMAEFGAGRCEKCSRWFEKPSAHFRMCVRCRWPLNDPNPELY